MRWCLDLALSMDGDAICATFRIGLQSAGRDFHLRRPSYLFSSPAIVRTLLRQFEVVDAGWPVTPDFNALLAGDISKFFEWLTDSRRALPVIVVTKHPSTGRPLVNPKVLAKEMAGVAHVVVLATHLASLALSDRAGAQRSVRQGAVRLYWPKFDVEADPRDHKLWIASRLMTDGSALVDELRRLLGSVSAASVPENAVIDRIRLARRRQVAASTELPEWVREYLDSTDAELRSLRDERNELKSSLAIALSNLAAISEQYDLEQRNVSSSSSAHSTSGSTGGVDISQLAVIDAYDRAKAEIGDDLVFLPSADDSIRDFVNYKDTSKLFQAILHVAEAGRKWREQTMGQPFGEFFSAHGYRYSARNPAAHDRRHKRHYQVRYKGRTVTLGPHLKVDESTSPDQCLRIYWYLDSDEKLLVIGHVGRHLPD